MKLIAVVGNTQEGKTTFVKELIKTFEFLNLKIWSFDILQDFTNESEKTFIDKNLIISELKKVRNKIVIIDEATSFFNYRSFDNELNQLLQLKAHNNHLFIFCYHSLKFVPEFLQMYLNYLVLFRTGDKINEYKDWNIDKPILNKFEYKTYKLL